MSERRYLASFQKIKAEDKAMYKRGKKIRPLLNVAPPAVEVGGCYCL